MGEEPSIVVVIYGLYDGSGRLRYIGKANDPGKRLLSHMRDSRRRDTPLYRWIRKNGRPEMRILAECCGDWRKEEINQIEGARIRGEKLLNVANGGDEPFCSTQQRRKNTTAMNLKRATDPKAKLLWEIKRMVMDSAKRGYLRDDQKEKFRALAEYRPDLFGCFGAL